MSDEKKVPQETVGSLVPKCAYCGDPATHPTDFQWNLWATCDRCWNRLKPKKRKAK